MSEIKHVYEIHPRRDHRGVDLISDVTRCFDPFRAREEPPWHSRSLLRYTKFLLQNYAIQRNAARISLAVVPPGSNGYCGSREEFAAEPSGSWNFNTAILFSRLAVEPGVTSRI